MRCICTSESGGTASRSPTRENGPYLHSIRTCTIRPWVAAIDVNGTGKLVKAKHSFMRGKIKAHQGKNLLVLEWAPTEMLALRGDGDHSSLWLTSIDVSKLDAHGKQGL